MEGCGGAGPVNGASHRHIEHARDVGIRGDDLDLMTALRHLYGELGNPARRATVPWRERTYDVEDPHAAAPGACGWDPATGPRGGERRNILDDPWTAGS